jgi:hypothetical protein
VTELIPSRRLLRLVRTQLFDYNAIARELFAADTGAEVTCRRGCAYCCYAKIVCDAATGALIFMYLYEEGLWTPALVQRLRDADAAMTALPHARWMGERHPCVFLAETEYGKGTCMVHAVRPFACASTFAAVPDPKACGVVGGIAQAQVHVHGPAQAIGEIYRRILAVAGEAEAWLFTLPGAVLYGAAMVQREPFPTLHRISWGEVAAAGNDVVAAFDLITKAVCHSGAE